MVVVSGRLTKLFNSVGHFTVVCVSEPDGWSAGIGFLQNTLHTGI